MTIPRTTGKRRGFAIMEALLAVAICGIMTTGIVLSIAEVAKLSFQAKRESAITRIIYNELMFTTTIPAIQEGTKTTQVEEWDIEIETNITLLEGLINKEGNNLDSLYKIEVKAIWWEDGEYANQSAETWRHLNLYVR